MVEYTRTAMFSLFKDQKALESLTTPTPTPVATPIATPTPIWTSPATGIGIGLPAGFQLGLGVCQGPIHIKAMRGAAEAPAAANLTITLNGFAATELYSRSGCSPDDAFSTTPPLNTPLVITSGTTKAKTPRGTEGFYIKTLGTSLAARTLTASSTPNAWTDSRALGVPALVPTLLKVVDPLNLNLGLVSGTPILLPAGRCSQRLEVRIFAANATQINAVISVGLSNSRRLLFYADSECLTSISSLAFAGTATGSFYLKEATLPSAFTVTVTAPGLSSGVANFAAERAITALRINPVGSPQLSLGVCNQTAFRINALDINSAVFGNGNLLVQEDTPASELFGDSACTQRLASGGSSGVYSLALNDGVTPNFYVKPKSVKLDDGYKITASLPTTLLRAEMGGTLKLVPVKIAIAGASTFTANQCAVLFLQLNDFYGQPISPENTVYPITLRMLVNGVPAELDNELYFYRNDGNEADPCTGTQRTTFQVPDIPGQAPLRELRLPFRDARMYWSERTFELQAAINGEFGVAKSFTIRRRSLELDPSFNFAATPPGIIAAPRTNSEFKGITLDAQNNAFPVGFSGSEASRKVLVGKLTPWGAWDLSFNGGAVDFAAGAKSGVTSVVPQSGSPGLFLVGGWSIANAESGLRDFFAARFSHSNPAQRPDITFGDESPANGNTGFATGKFTTEAPGQAIASFSDGRFVMVGTNGVKMALALFSAAGLLVERKTFQMAPTSIDHATSVLITAIGGSERILIAGDTQIPGGYLNFALVCLKITPPAESTGSILDFCDDFGTGGKAMANFGNTSFASAIVRQGEKILLAGTTEANGAATQTPSNLALARFLEDGRLDSASVSGSDGFGFNGNGKAIFDLGSSETVNAVAVGRDNRIVVVGKSAAGAQTRGFIARLAPNGATFSNDPASTVSLPFQSRNAEFTALAIDAWRRFVIVGNALADETQPSQAFVTRLFE